MEHGCCCNCFVCKIGKSLGLISECKDGCCKNETKKVARKVAKKKVVKKKVVKKAKK